MTKARVRQLLADIRDQAATELSAAEREALADLLAQEGLTSGTAFGAAGRDFDPSDVSVEWREAAPEERPSGMDWDPETATLTYDCWAAQQDCRAALSAEDADLVAFLGGYGTGKSIFGARWLIAQALTYPGSRFLAMGENYRKARNSTYRILFKQLPGITTPQYQDCETSPLVADHNRTDNRLVLCNESVIVTGSGGDWRDPAGDEYGAVWLDEPSLYEADLHALREMVGSRFRGVDGPQAQCWTLTGNGYNDAWEIIEQRQDKTGDPIGSNIECIRASTLDNPYLDEGTLQGLKRQFLDTEREAQALHGEFDAVQGLVYGSFRRERHVIPRDEAMARIDDDWRIYGYDAGWNDPRVVVEIGRTGVGQLIVVDEFHETESHMDAVIDWLETNDKPRGKFFADHAPGDINRIRRAGYNTREADRALDPGISDVRRRLREDAEGRVGLLVADCCEHLSREFLGYKTEDVGTARATDHCLDALRYAIHGFDDGDRIESWDEVNRGSDSIITVSPIVGNGHY